MFLPDNLILAIQVLFSSLCTRRLFFKKHQTLSIMRFPLRSTVVLFAAVLLTLSYARIVPLKPRDDEPDEDSCPIDRAVCTAGQGNSQFIRFRRAMKLPGDPEFDNDIDRFMKTQAELAQNVVIDDTTCTAVYSSLAEQAVNWAVKDMCGCSALIVVSEKAMYFTHYFENLAFCGTKEAPSNFKREVLDALDNGAVNQESLAGHSADFRDQPGLGAFIMTPTTEKSSSLKYRIKVQQLQGKVNDIVGITPKIISYKPEDCAFSEILGTNALGAALFQYDPNQRQEDPKKLAKVWVERTDAYTHEWPTPSSTETVPTVNPVNPPSEPSCYPSPTSDYQDAHEENVERITFEFCRIFANSVVTDPTVSIVKQFGMDESAQREDKNDLIDDVYDITIKSVENCKPEGEGFNLAEPVPGHSCQEILFNAWLNCEHHFFLSSWVFECFFFFLVFLAFQHSSNQLKWMRLTY